MRDNMTIEIQGLDKQDAQRIKSKGFTVEDIGTFHDTYDMTLSNVGIHTHDSGSSILLKDLKGGDTEILTATEYGKITIF